MSNKSLADNEFSYENNLKNQANNDHVMSSFESYNIEKEFPNLEYKEEKTDLSIYEPQNFNVNLSWN